MLLSVFHILTGKTSIQIIPIISDRALVEMYQHKNLPCGGRSGVLPIHFMFWPPAECKSNNHSFVAVFLLLLLFFWSLPNSTGKYLAF